MLKFIVPDNKVQIERQIKALKWELENNKKLPSKDREIFEDALKQLLEID